MNPEDVGRILDEIGERIGPAGEYAWTLVVRQVVIEGTVWAIAGAVVLVASAVIAALSVRRLELDPNADISWIFAMVIGAVGAVAFTIIAANSLVILLNPEYHAMIRLLDRVVP